MSTSAEYPQTRAGFAAWISSPNYDLRFLQSIMYVNGDDWIQWTQRCAFSFNIPIRVVIEEARKRVGNF